MSMYPPLKFVEQMEHYVELDDKSRSEEFANDLAIQFAEDFIAQNRSKLYHDFLSMHSFPTYAKIKKIEEFYAPIKADFCKKLEVVDVLQLAEFLLLMIEYDIRGTWRKNKLSYLVDDELLKILMTMEVPKAFATDCLTKLPANCFYIDYNGMGSEFMEGFDGSFIITDKTDEELNMVLIHLFRGKSGRELYFTTACFTKLNGKNKFDLVSDINAKETFTDEEGTERTFYIGKYMSFIYNFFVYLQASNRDVEISERTRQNHTKPVQTIKNKFREVKEFEVGFVYGRTIGKDKKRIKYVGEAKGTGVHSPKASHYRSAHWHHYWVGSGDDKRLIIKWIEGIFVKGNGDEAKNIRVCKVV